MNKNKKHMKSLMGKVQGYGT